MNTHLHIYSTAPHKWVFAWSEIGNEKWSGREKESTSKRIEWCLKCWKGGLRRVLVRTQCILSIQYNRSSSHLSSNFFKDIFTHTHALIRTHINIFNRFVRQQQQQQQWQRYTTETFKLMAAAVTAATASNGIAKIYTHSHTQRNASTAEIFAANTHRYDTNSRAFFCP